MTPDLIAVLEQATTNRVSSATDRDAPSGRAALSAGAFAVESIDVAAILFAAIANRVDPMRIAAAVQTQYCSPLGAPLVQSLSQLVQGSLTRVPAPTLEPPVVVVARDQSQERQAQLRALADWSTEAAELDWDHLEEIDQVGWGEGQLE
jgi:hypothetical protein